MFKNKFNLNRIKILPQGLLVTIYLLLGDRFYFTDGQIGQ
jgi:hypothetical protein